MRGLPMLALLRWRRTSVRAVIANAGRRNLDHGLVIATRDWVQATGLDTTQWPGIGCLTAKQLGCKTTDEEPPAT